MQYKDTNDYELIYRIRENTDDYAEEIIYKKYEPIVLSLSKKYFLLVKNGGVEYEDLIQEGRMGIIRALKTYNENQDCLFYSYVCRCIESSIVSCCRKINRKKHGPLNGSVDDECLYFYKDDSFNPEICVFDRLISQNLFIETKNRLELNDSIIYELRVNGFSRLEISKLLDISVRSVDTRLCKIRNTLQTVVDKS